MDLNLITAILAVLFGLISIFIGIWVAGRFSGKLKQAIILLLVGVGIFTLNEIANIFRFIIGIDYQFVRSVASAVGILFMLLATLKMKATIDKIDGHYKRNKL